MAIENQHCLASLKAAMFGYLFLVSFVRWQKSKLANVWIWFLNTKADIYWRLNNLQQLSYKAKFLIYSFEGYENRLTGAMPISADLLGIDSEAFSRKSKRLSEYYKITRLTFRLSASLFPGNDVIKR